MKILLTIILVVIVLAGAAGLVMYSGIYNIGVTNHDNTAVNWCLDTAATRSVQFHARGISVPSLTDPAMIRTGVAHYREMCVACHGAPGVEPDEIAQGLWPVAPKLSGDVSSWTPAQLFWIVKNGIKFTAMPAWGPSHDDDKIWAIVAFLEKQPQLSPAEYTALIKAAGTDEPEAHHD